MKMDVASNLIIHLLTEHPEHTFHLSCAIYLIWQAGAIALDGIQNSKKIHQETSMEQHNWEHSCIALTAMAVTLFYVTLDFVNITMTEIEEFKVWYHDMKLHEPLYSGAFVSIAHDLVSGMLFLVFTFALRHIREEENENGIFFERTYGKEK